MLDLGFSEMMVIAVVALVVLGPERLPKVAKTVGHLVGRMQRYVADVKSDITREMELDELRKFRQTVEETASSVQSSFNSFETDARTTAGDMEALARGEGRGAPVAHEALSAGMSLPGDEVTPTPMPWPDPAPAALAAPYTEAEAWVEPTVAGAMSSRAGMARYTATASIAMGSVAAPLTGARRWPEVLQPAEITRVTLPAVDVPAIVGMDPAPSGIAARTHGA